MNCRFLFYSPAHPTAGSPATRAWSGKSGNDQSDVCCQYGMVRRGAQAHRIIGMETELIFPGQKRNDEKPGAAYAVILNVASKLKYYSVFG